MTIKDKQTTTTTKLTKAQFEALPKNEKLNCILEGKAYFAFIQNPDTKTAERFPGAPVAYKMCLGLDEKGVKKAISLGFKINEPTDNIPMPFITIKRNVKDPNNPKKEKPKVVDMLQQVIPETILIGNGSEVRIAFNRYWYVTNGGGVGAALTKVQVKKLEVFEKNNDGLELDENGFNVNDLLQNASVKDGGKVIGDTDEGLIDPDLFDN